MKYKQHIGNELAKLGTLDHTIFLGEGIINAGRCYDTLNEVPLTKCIEMPIAENLIVGSAIGLALAGYYPIVVFQRMDFMLVAADAIINHIAKLPEMSGNQIIMPIVIRTILGSTSKKFEMGPQHCADYRHVFSPYIKCIDYRPGAYLENFSKPNPIIIIERKDDYENDCTT